jgi:hypothetical protein
MRHINAPEALTREARIGVQALEVHHDLGNDSSEEYA